MNTTTAFSVGDLQDLISRAKAGSRKFVTNFFVPSQQWQTWIQRGLRPAMVDHSAFVLGWPEENCIRLFFAGERSVIAAALARTKGFSSQPLTVDLIGRGKEVKELADEFAAVGFAPHLRLFRLSCSKVPDSIKSDPAIFACPLAEACDIPGIHALLGENFDAYADALPATVAIQDAIDAGEIRVARREVRVDGFVWYTQTGITASIRYWCVGKCSRERGVGSRLMRDYFARTKNCSRHLLWVRANNPLAQSCYNHYGYRPDGLEDHVMVWKN